MPSLFDLQHLQSFRSLADPTELDVYASDEVPSDIGIQVQGLGNALYRGLNNPTVNSKHALTCMTKQKNEA